VSRLPGFLRLLVSCGGRALVFLVNGLLAMLGTSPEDTIEVPISASLRRPLFGMHRFEWPDDDAVSFTYLMVNGSRCCGPTASRSTPDRAAGRP
jgi:hypothetical protein